MRYLLGTNPGTIDSALPRKLVAAASVESLSRVRGRSQPVTHRTTHRLCIGYASVMHRIPSGQALRSSNASIVRFECRLKPDDRLRLGSRPHAADELLELCVAAGE